MEEAPSEFARALAENARFADSFDRSVLSAAPLTGLAVLTCMDGRIIVEDVLGLRAGDAHILRNAGAHATDDVVRSLVVSQQVMGTNVIVVIAHSGCGLHGANEASLRARVAADRGASADTVDLAFGAFPDLEAHVRDQVDRLRTEPYLRDVPVHGLIYDVETGRLHEVV